jgi:hypothetical protein
LKAHFFRSATFTYRKWNESIFNQRLLDHDDFARLTAIFVSGSSIGIGNEVSWARRRDSSVCVIDDSGAVSIPYAVFHLTAD